MAEKIMEYPSIYRIDVPLPDNPLRNLNCYCIQDEGHTLMIDTGFHCDACMQALQEGLRKIGAVPQKTELFLTHMHGDHVGLAKPIAENYAKRVYIHELDYLHLRSTMTQDRWEIPDEIIWREGFEKELLHELRYGEATQQYHPAGLFDAVCLKDGDTVQVGKYTLQAIWVPGHTPGQMCLYLKEKKLMFTADHILFDITPNITAWYGVEDSLGDYLQSLLKIRQYPIAQALPSHRGGSTDVYGRIETIIEHHLQRLQETAEVLEQYPDRPAVEIASHLKWSMRGKTWDNFPVSQRWFALGETIAHLDYLIKRGFAVRREGKLRGYCLRMPAAECKAELEKIWQRYYREKKGGAADGYFAEINAGNGHRLSADGRNGAAVGRGEYGAVYCKVPQGNDGGFGRPEHS